MLTKAQVLASLRCPNGKGVRSIYEVVCPRGHFHINYAAFPGGTTEEVPFNVIAELEGEGLIKRSFPDSPEINSWRLKE